MPLPPPPALGLISTGKPMPLRLAQELRVRLVVAVVAGQRRHAELAASRRPAALSPSARMAAAGGPTQVMPAAVTASANSAFSARKP